MHLIDIYNVIEAVRDAGLNAVELNAGISVTRLENLVSSLFNQLSKRLPTTHTINPRESTALLVEFLLAAVDRYIQRSLRRKLCILCMLTSSYSNMKHLHVWRRHTALQCHMCLFVRFLFQWARQPSDSALRESDAGHAVWRETDR